MKNIALCLLTSAALSACTLNAMKARNALAITAITSGFSVSGYVAYHHIQKRIHEKPIQKLAQEIEECIAYTEQPSRNPEYLLAVKAEIPLMRARMATIQKNHYKKFGNTYIEQYPIISSTVASTSTLVACLGIISLAKKRALK
jgi:hypothetical protein